ncbi:hypothetical protein NC652_038173 [Populus alba x Populus x berolinensis]|uniref:Uncharacterized protein n=1 Tax=Populus alba x Populus x berolinensis TaxID=444605 RepID=A0AAD6LHG9_9ROSI|nr:hypothetical protein NC652_038173 [Populus alba x Populus x berolinensis]KAJ6960033.1 hypothetical protein NC653_038171 [Populus alba x Populus x berolinensis]
MDSFKTTRFQVLNLEKNHFQTLKTKFSIVSTNLNKVKTT